MDGRSGNDRPNVGVADASTMDVAIEDALVDAATHPEPLHPRSVRSVALAVEAVLRFLTGVTVAALLVLLLWNILLRAANMGGAQVPTEIVELLFSWFVFLGSAILVYQWDHIEVPLIYVMIRSPRMQIVSRAVVVLLCLAFSLLLASSSAALMAASSGRTSPMLHLPQGYWYGSILAGSVLMALAMAVRLVDYAIRLAQLRGRDSAGGA